MASVIINGRDLSNTKYCFTLFVDLEGEKVDLNKATVFIDIEELIHSKSLKWLFDVAPDVSFGVENIGSAFRLFGEKVDLTFNLDEIWGKEHNFDFAYFPFSAGTVEKGMAWAKSHRGERSTMLYDYDTLTADDIAFFGSLTEKELTELCAFFNFLDMPHLWQIALSYVFKEMRGKSSEEKSKIVGNYITNRRYWDNEELIGWVQSLLKETQLDESEETQNP